MTKWEKLNLKLQLVNLNLEVDRYFIDYDSKGTPVLYWTDGESIQEDSHGIEEIDDRLADIFITFETKVKCVTNFLKERIF